MEHNHDKCFSQKNVKDYYKNQMTHLSGSGMFTDEIFPPNFQSLMGVDKQGNLIDQYLEQQDIDEIKHEKIEWKRAADIFPSGFKVFDKVEIEDIKQGGLGNCYFLSAIAALAEFPCIIKHIFKTRETNPNGFYEVVMFIDGIWQIVVVDDYFPVFKNTRQLAFTQTNGNEIWVLILEKAWAKVNKGYVNIIGGLASDAFGALTSFPAINLNHKNVKPDILWEKISEADQLNEVMCTATDSDEQKQKSAGLVPGHAYTITSAKSAVYNGKEIRLLKIRNPWGDTEWKGDWSDKSRLWNPELKAQFGLNDKDDGSFWISLEDFLDYFDSTNICKILYDEKAKYFKLKGSQLNAPNVFNIHLREDSRLSLSVLRKHWRYNRELRNMNHPISIIIGKYNLSTKDFSFVSGFFSSNDSVDYYKHLRSGHYVIWIYYNIQACDGPQLDELNFRVTSVSNYYVTQKGQDQDFTLLRELILTGCRYLYEKEIKTEKIFLDCQHNFKNTGIGYAFCSNNSTNKVNLRIGYSGVVGYSILGNNGDPETIGINPEGQTVAVGMRKASFGSYGFCVDCSYGSRAKDGVGSKHIADVSHLQGDLTDYPSDYDHHFEVIHKHDDPNHKNMVIQNNKPKTARSGKVIAPDHLYEEPKTIEVKPLGGNVYNPSLHKDEPRTIEVKPLGGNTYITPSQDPQTIEVRKLGGNTYVSPNYSIEHREYSLQDIQREFPDIMDKVLQLPKLNNDSELRWKYVNFGKNYYVGQVNKDNVIEGRGAYVSNPETYISQWRNTKANGFGKIYDKNNLVYNGGFYNDNYDGQGKLNYRNGDYYDGQFKDGNLDGRGQYTFNNGDSWEGNFNNNKLHGKGVYTDKYGSKSEREYYNGVRV